MISTIELLPMYLDRAVDGGRDDDHVDAAAPDGDVGDRRFVPVRPERLHEAAGRPQEPHVPVGAPVRHGKVLEH